MRQAVLPEHLNTPKKEKWGFKPKIENNIPVQECKTDKKKGCD